MIYLATVSHDIKTNTLEAGWFEETENGLKRVRCINYSSDQKSQFLADCGEDAQKYIDMADW